MGDPLQIVQKGNKWSSLNKEINKEKSSIQNPVFQNLAYMSSKKKVSAYFTSFCRENSNALHFVVSWDRPEKLATKWWGAEKNNLQNDGC